MSKIFILKSRIFHSVKAKFLISFSFHAREMFSFLFLFPTDPEKYLPSGRLKIHFFVAEIFPKTTGFQD